MKKHNFVHTVLLLILFIITAPNVFGISGDINGSGRVDGKDLAFLARYYGENTNAVNHLADLNLDGVINTNDYIILNANFGKTDVGGAAAWVSDNSKVYKLSVDNGTVRSTISGIPGTPVLNDINPDTGEAWVVCNVSNLIYVISPFVPLEYNVISNSGQFVLTVKCITGMVFQRIMILRVIPREFITRNFLGCMTPEEH